MFSRQQFKFYHQHDHKDCGPTCLRMIAKYYGKHFNIETLRKRCFATREGSTLKGINDAATQMGFRTLGGKMTFEQLDEEATLPCILYWNQKHFVVLPPQRYNRSNVRSRITIADPAHGMVKVTRETFMKCWALPGTSIGVALLMEPSPLFYDNEDEARSKKDLSFLYRYLTPYRKYIFQLFLGMVIGCLFSLIAPFLTQSLIDNGVNQHNLGFIYLILISQLALFLGTMAIAVVRSWLLLHMSARINISIISDFLIKLMKLPIRFFDTKMVGDITQRVNDHNRIEQFLTGTSLTTLFSFLNLIIFSIVLAVYSIPVLLLFFIGSALSVVWIMIFLKRRKELDYARFQRMSDNQNSIFEIITGMQEIKMNDSEMTHRWTWERIQAKLFKINIRSLILEQYQMLGTGFFTQLKNILISFVAAKEVLNGDLSLGAMLSISYITGQMNSPIEQLLSFFRAAQDAKISVDRLSEIHSLGDEEKEGELRPEHEMAMMIGNGGGTGIRLENVSFRYAGPESPMVLNNINLTIPFGKVTAIVGASGSGKTTLMKLLLKFYEPVQGSITLGHTPLNLISARWWRNQCGVVMSEGYIFSNTLEKNISVQEDTDLDRLSYAVKMAQLESFVRDLPLGYSTQLGNTGNGISSGQRQRILIARAIYKQPKLLFLDEATSTLDANNEKTIIDNLDRFFEGKTVLIIAHRLSTVKYADQIVVLENGEIAEIGNHASLTALKGKYYRLVKNQLELGT